MKPITDISRLVAPEVPGCPGLMIDDAVRFAAIELCRRVPVLRKDDYSQTMTAGYNFYDHPTGFLVRRIHQAWLDGKKITVSHPDLMKEADGDWMNETGTPTALIADEKGYRPYPLGTGDVTAMVSLVPAPDAQELDDLLVDEYAETISAGAKARLLEKPAVTWSNPKLGAYYMDLFEQGIDDAEFWQYRNVPLRTAPPPV